MVRKLRYNKNSITGRIISDDDEMESIQDILYGAKNWRESTFIFTLDANEEVGEAGDNYMNCMCVLFEELVKRESDEQLFITQKGFCIMFSNNYFPAHIEVLNGLLYSLRCERFKL